MQAKSKADGSFHIALIPGKYKFNCGPNYVEREEDLWLSGIRPFSIELQPGEVFDLGDIAFGGGSRNLTGRVVDQYGKPISGLLVIGYPGDELGEGEPSVGFGSPLARGLTEPGRQVCFP